MSSSTFAPPCLALLVAACDPSWVADRREPPPPDVALRGAADAPAAPHDAAAIALDPTPGRYREQCDGSAAIGLDAEHFLAFSDSDQRARVYRRGALTGPLRNMELGAALGVGVGAKVDLEDAVRVGGRIYAISSHGRTNDGAIDPDRYRFVALEVTGSAPDIALVVSGSRTRLVADLLDASRWSTPPGAGLLGALANATQLAQPVVASLAPKQQGLNLEGLARAPVAGAPERLVIGLRNPRPGGRAVVVSLMNPEAVAAGGAATFGEVMELELGGLGIRGMTWLEAMHVVLVIAGPHDDSSGPFRLYRWAGTPGSTPSFVAELDAPGGAKPESIVTYPNTTDVEIVYDADDVVLGGATCDDTAQSGREFVDRIVHVQ